MFWLGMMHDIDLFVHKKCLCLRQRKRSRKVKAPLLNIVTAMPLELISVDYVKLEQGSGDNKLNL